MVARGLRLGPGRRRQLAAQALGFAAVGVQRVARGGLGGLPAGALGVHAGLIAGALRVAQLLGEAGPQPHAGHGRGGNGRQQQQAAQVTAQCGVQGQLNHSAL